MDNESIRNMTIEELEDNAITGDIESVEELIRRYSDGDGVDADPEKAAEWTGFRDNLNESVYSDYEDSTEQESVIEDRGEAESSADTADKKIWGNYYNAIKDDSLLDLRVKSEKGDPAAMIILAERYLSSDNREEIDEGFRLLNEAESLLKDEFSKDGNTFTKDALVYLFDLKGNGYLKLLSYDLYTDERGYAAKEVFDAFSNAHELDPNQVKGLMICYEQGIGVEKDPIKANEYHMKLLESAGIWDRVQYANQKMQDGMKLIGTEWLQRALLSEDADSHPAAEHYARILLGQNGDADENGAAINVAEERDALQMMAEDHDAEAALLFAELQNDYSRKLHYYELGINGADSDSALKCREKAEETQKKITDVQASEAKKVEEEIARKAFESEKAKEEAKSEMRKSLKDMSRVIAVILIVAFSLLYAYEFYGCTAWLR